MTAINLSALPAPQIIEALDYEAILEQWLADLLAIYPEAADVIQLESEPLKKLLEVGAYREMALRSQFNNRAKGLLLAYSRGTDLDHIGITYFDGTERLPGETDERYLERLLLKPDSYSTAGSANSYRYHALSASADVLDARCIKGAVAGTVVIPVLSKNDNGSASPELLALVTAALNADEVRPQNDTVIVQTAAILEYEIEAIITVGAGPSAAPVLQAAINRAQKYADNQRKLGAGIKRDAVLAALWIDGVADVELTKPTADIAATALQSTYCTEIKVELNE